MAVPLVQTTMWSFGCFQCHIFGHSVFPGFETVAQCFHYKDIETFGPRKTQLFPKNYVSEIPPGGSSMSNGACLWMQQGQTNSFP